MKVALVGNPNSGKSTLFNSLTGENQKIGNWPGVTIEKKSGVIEGTNIELIDLPGTYSLNPYTKEEEVTTEFIKKGKFDKIINIIDCNSISRGLYLTMQLLEQNQNVMLALNMYDIAERKGIYIDEVKLSKALGNIDVIKISALKGEGLEDLVSKTKNNITLKSNTNLIINDDEERIVSRYRKIDEILDDAIQRIMHQKETLTDKIDKIVLNKFLAIPIFLIVMLGMYYVSIDIIGNTTINSINIIFEQINTNLKEYLEIFNASHILISLLTNGIVNGVSAVISFLPQLIFLFLIITMLEKNGYLSRVSLIFNKIFNKIGLSGNSIIPFIIGTGCSVPGIMATKTIKSENEKRITSIVTSFVPCSAKLPIISLFSSYFFDENSGIIAISFYFTAIIVIIISSMILRKKIKGVDNNSYVAELPEYRIPHFKQVIKEAIERTSDFVKRAGSIILLSSIIIWFLLSYSSEFEYGINVEDSILASIGRTFSWLFVPIVGCNSWEVAVSSIQGLVAKEQVISSMSIIAGLAERKINANLFVNGSPFNFFTPVSAYAFVCFNLFSAPCFGAIGAMKKALGGNVKVLKAIGFQTLLAYFLSSMIYFVGSLICEV